MTEKTRIRVYRSAAEDTTEDLSRLLERIHCLIFQLLATCASVEARNISQGILFSFHFLLIPVYGLSSFCLNPIQSFS